MTDAGGLRMAHWYGTPTWRLTSACVVITQISRALLAGASGQLRNQATAAGVICSSARCPYFLRHQSALPISACGSGCAALEGFSRQHAVVGVSEACIATHPSDMAVAMRLLDAVVETITPEERLAVSHWLIFIAQGKPPHLKPPCFPVSFIVAVTLPPPLGGKHIYRKVRDRASYAFALVSVAAIIQPDGSGRVALGGVAHKPWRIEAADAQLSQGAQAVLTRCSPAPIPPLKTPLNSCWRSERLPPYWLKPGHRHEI
ncbi:FAD binding domain-containing protein [Escherichia coli]